jgi:hypothetical protein
MLDEKIPAAHGVQRGLCPVHPVALGSVVRMLRLALWPSASSGALTERAPRRLQAVPA